MHKSLGIIFIVARRALQRGHVIRKAVGARPNKLELLYTIGRFWANCEARHEIQNPFNLSTIDGGCNL